MSAIAKPAKREKRAPKPISRNSQPKRTKRPRKQRKGKRANLGREADRLWSLLTRTRKRCTACNGTEYMQAAHGFSRRYRATRWLPINGFCLCRKCHVYYTHRPLEWDQWLRGPLGWGEPTYTELRYLALGAKPVDMEATIKSLRAELSRLSGGNE